MEKHFDKQNPFWDNHIFSKKDLERVVFKWWHYPVLWFLPMKIQITDDGVAYYKVWNGAYYFYRLEALGKSKDSFILSSDPIGEVTFNGVVYVPKNK